MDAPYHIRNPKIPLTGLIISCPHAGREFPAESSHYYSPGQVACPVDTDWFVETLYDFAPALGIPLLWGRYSRYLIDLNRPLNEERLYTDQRLQTGLIPKTTFAGEAIYQPGEPKPEEIARRIRTIYEPYHQELQRLADQVHAELGYVLILEGHSIRRHVPTISKEAFPDMILGNNDQQTLPQTYLDLAGTALLSKGNYRISKNHPFKGGFITRSFAKPSEQRFTLQLEMSQDLYMDEKAFVLLPQNAENIKIALKTMVQTLLNAMKDQYGR